MHESILAYRGRRYLWVSLVLSAVSIALYAWHDPLSPPNGGTWLGYGLGGVGAALILWLALLGVRKRRYASTLGTVQGWVSAHVYLGLALLVVVTLHAGFQFGWNVHTLAYALMVVVVASGLLGIVLYARLPAARSANRASQTPEQMLATLEEIDRRALRVAGRLPPEFADALRSNRDRTRIGGTLLAILSASDGSRVLLPGPGGVAQLVANPGQSRLLDWLGAELSRSSEGERSQAIAELVSLTAARRDALARLKRESRLAALLELWLYVHVPVTFALLGALIAHVVSVFLYW